MLHRFLARQKARTQSGFVGLLRWRHAGRGLRGRSAERAVERASVRRFVELFLPVLGFFAAKD